MSISIYYGDALLRDDLGAGEDSIQIDPDWAIGFEESFRSAQKYGRGQGGASLAIRFRLESHHATRLEKLNWQRAIYYSLHGSDLTKPRDLWFLELAASPVPFSWGMALANKPRFVDQGHDGTYFILVTEYEFICDLLAYGGQNLAPSTPVTPPTYLPNLWLPNAYGMVLRRTSDNAWIQVTWNMSTNEPQFADLEGDPGTTNYEAVTSDLEWPAANRGPGFYTTGVYRLIGLDDYKQYTIAPGTATTDFAAGYTMTKGIVFALGKGPIFRSPGNLRRKMTIGAGNVVEWTDL